MANPHKKLVSFDIPEFSRAAYSLIETIEAHEWKKASKSRTRRLSAPDSRGQTANIRGRFNIINATMLFGLVYFDFNVPKATNFLARFFALIDLAQSDDTRWKADRKAGTDRPAVFSDATLLMAAQMHPKALEDYMVKDIKSKLKRLKHRYRKLCHPILA